MSKLGSILDNAGDFCKNTYKKATLALAGGLLMGNMASAQEVPEWSMSMGYVTKSPTSLYTPAGFYFEAIVPAFGKSTAFRGGAELIKEGKLNYAFETDFNNQKGFVGVTQLYNQGYVDFMVRPNIPVAGVAILQPYAFGGLGFAPNGVVQDNYNQSSIRYGGGVNAFIGNKTDSFLKAFIGVEALGEKRRAGLISNFLPVNEAYKPGLNFGLKLGIAATF